MKSKRKILIIFLSRLESINTFKIDPLYNPFIAQVVNSNQQASREKTSLADGLCKYDEPLQKLHHLKESPLAEYLIIWPKDWF